MSFARAKRDNLFDKEIKNKENFPGPGKYNPKSSGHVNGFKYFNSTSTSILERSMDDLDSFMQSTPKVTKPNSRYSRQKMTRGDLMLHSLESDHKALKVQYKKIQDLKDELEQKYTEASNKCERFQAVESKYKSMVEKKDSEITNLKIEIQINEERMTELKMQEEHAHKESIENQSKNLDMSKRVESLDDCIKKHQVLIEQKSKLLETVQLELYNSKEIERELKAKQNKYDVERARYIDEINDQKADMADANGLILQRETEIESLNSQVKERIDLIQQYMETAQKMEDQNCALEENQISLEADKSGLEADIENLKFRIEELEGIVQALEEENEKLKEQQANLSSKATEISSEIQSSKDLVNFKEAQIQILEEELKTEKTVLSEEKAQINKELSSAKTTIQDTEATLISERLEHESAVKKYEETLKISEDQLEEIKNDVFEKINIIENLEETNSNLNSEKTSWDSKLAEKDCEISSKSEIISKLENTVQDLENEKLIMVEQSASSIEEKESFQVQLSEASKKYSDLQIANDKFTPLLEARQTELSNMQREFANCVEKNKKLAHDKEELRKGGIMYRNKRDLWKSECEKIEIQKKQLTETMNKQIEAQKSSVEKANMKVREIQNELQVLRASQSKEKMEREFHDKRIEEIEALELALSKAERSSDEWENRYKELEVFISPFRQELAKYAEERNHLDKENKKKNAELSDLTSKLANQMGHQNQRQKIHYLSKIKQENLDLRNELGQSHLELKKTRRQMDSLKEDLNAVRGIRRFDPKKAFQQE